MKFSLICSCAERVYLFIIHHMVIFHHIDSAKWKAEPS